MHHYSAQKECCQRPPRQYCLVWWLHYQRLFFTIFVNT